MGRVVSPDTTAGMHPSLPLMREVAFALQKPEGETTTPQSKNGSEEPFFDSSPHKGSPGPVSFHSNDCRFSMHCGGLWGGHRTERLCNACVWREPSPRHTKSSVRPRGSICNRQIVAKPPPAEKQGAVDFISFYLGKHHGGAAGQIQLEAQAAILLNAGGIGLVMDPAKAAVGEIIG